MRLIDIYKSAIKRGIENDPRPRAEIRGQLAKARREFKASSARDKRGFDRERLTNPYADTRILYGAPDKDIRTVMVGIDMESQELLAADRLNERGEAIDIVMEHHPEGAAWAAFYDVM